MVKFVIAGPVNCPYFAKIEILAQLLKKSLPDFDYRTVLKSPNEWINFAKEICKVNNWQLHLKSPLIWRESLEFGGPKLYFGGFNEFQEYAKVYYSLEIKISSCEMQMLADANVKNRAKETSIEYSLITNIIITVVFASSSVCYFLLPLIIDGNIFTEGNLLEIRLFDISKSVEINKVDMEMMAMELENCSYPNLKAISVCDNLPEALVGAHLVIICPCKPIIDDLHLEHKLQRVGWLIKHQATEGVKVMVVYECSNTTDMNVCNLRLHLTNHISPLNIIAITGCVQERGKRRLAEKMNLHPSQISNLLFWGFNSRNVDAFHFDINFSTVENCINSSIYCHNITSHVSRLTPNDAWLQKTLPKMAITHLTSKSDPVQNAMSLASSAAKVLKMWWHGSEPNIMYCVCVPVADAYNMGNGMFLLLPVLFSKPGEYLVVDKLPIDATTSTKLQSMKSNYVNDMLDVMFSRANEVNSYKKLLSTDPMLDEPSPYVLDEKPSLEPEILKPEVQEKPDEDPNPNETSLYDFGDSETLFS